MGMFSGIMEKLGFNRGRQASSPPPGMRTGDALGQSAQPPSGTQPSATQPSSGAASRSTAPLSEVDVMGKLESLAAANPQKLNWRESIVDLLKLLGMDSSLEARKALARELGAPADKMNDSAQMNLWLHQAVLRKVAENGGNVPKELLH
jgi:hypothetical protein